MKRPIHFGQILQKLKKTKEYPTMGHAKRDIDLLWSNCYLFNGQPDPDRPTQLNSFANWVFEREWMFAEYMKKFESNLNKMGWIGSSSQSAANLQSLSSSATSSPASSSRSERHSESPSLSPPHRDKSRKSKLSKTSTKLKIPVKGSSKKRKESESKTKRKGVGASERSPKKRSSKKRKELSVVCS